MGMSADAAATLERLDREFQSLRRAPRRRSASPHRRRRCGPGRSAAPCSSRDDRNECELLAAFLRLSGVEVATAGDGADALDYLRAPPSRVVLLDMIMPRCDGPTTVRAIAKTRPSPT